MAEAASTRLISHAAELSEAIFGAVNQGGLKAPDRGYRIASDVAVRLHLIGLYLQSLPPYWIEPEIEQLCDKILRDSENISRPTKRSSLSTLLFGQDKHTDPQSSLLAFFQIQIEDAQNFKITCDDLLTKLTKDDNVAGRLPDSALRLNTREVLEDFNNSVFEALQHIAFCDPESHETKDTALMSQDDPSQLWHPARLCLHEPENQTSVPGNISILVSAMDMEIWQEFCLRIRLEDTVDDERQVLSQGGFCPILEMNITARLFLEFNHGHGLFWRNKEAQVLNGILQAGDGESLKNVVSQYKLTAKDKVILSYAIAHSYYKYYDSELMQINWTSDRIWFMPEEDNNGQKGQLPLRAYISLPFGLTSSTMLDVAYEDLLIHRCPRIFDLGVLLLEIGLAKPFQTPRRRPDIVAQANLNHKTAINDLFELENLDWDGFTHKKYFDSAVKYCLNRDNFVPPQSESKLDWNGQKGILRRRRMLYYNVVCPLAWLAKEGFKAQCGDLTFVSKKFGPPRRRASNTTLPLEPEALFHSNIVPKMWLTDLQKISEQVERKRREYRVTTAIRVAILDTGLNRDFPWLKTNDGLIKSITDEADFTKSSPPTMTDTSGHGTFMARLIMECAPGVEVSVARVAENTNALNSSRESIKEAILWAGQTVKADIISMSFGFPSDDQGIRDAIETVYKSRGEDVIFFASAGNSSTDDESFPARHPHVISVYATNCYGAFLQSNSASTSNGAAVLGTYGDDIPDFIRQEFGTMYPKVCQPGSSVATAIMAGIGATLLAYGSVLPSLVSLQGLAAATGNRVLGRLRTAKGMEAVLHRLAQKEFDHPRLKAVNPIWFWKSRPSDIERYFAILDALSDVDRKSPRGTKAG
ncbi:hypothetical protein F5X98DRAFT_359004 [Xylaria grammica]|nr:hypothetical protein F5X98DRAFT_359004 [Xylaria grammica]